ncbi:MAG: LysM peptidoglycan-binding domain-containing protein [Liquorilactobacillus sp.]|uniref:muramidase family protein n=1 Tax=Liquorilactobacillus sp. TaxID=2767923 RepID=UPI0039EAEA11
MKKRRERIAHQKYLQQIKHIKGISRTASYVGTGFLLGSAALPIFKVKANTTTSQNAVTSAAGSINTDASSSTLTSNTSSASSTNSVASSTESTSSSAAESTANSSSSAQKSSVVSSSSSSSQDSAASSSSSSANTAISSASAITLNTSSLTSAPVKVSAFINSIASAAQQVAQQYNLYASLMIAQAATESAWGTSSLSTRAHNLFGIKYSGSGSYITMNTSEYYSGTYHTVSAKFQSYSSYSDSLVAYAKLISNNFSNSTKANAASVSIAASNLAKGKYGTYATDPTYATKLLSIISQYNLTKYDTTNSNSSNTSSSNSSSSSSSSNDNSSSGSSTSDSSTTSYIVKSGDSLWAIANKYGISVANLKSWNSLSSDTIYIGQALKVSASSQSSSSSSSSSSSNSDNSSSSASSTASTYTVKSGDSLWAIANKYGVSVANLKSWNSLSSSIIYIGQALKVSNSSQSNNSSSSSSSSSTNNSSNSTSSSTSNYTVKSGDSLWAIANKYGISVANLKSWNSLSSDTIYIGQALKVSAPSQSSSSSSSSGTSNSGNSSASTTASYTVKSGDSLWAIANKYGVSVANLKSWNSLSSDIVYIGQALKVSNTASQSSSNSSSSNNSNNSNKSSSETSATSSTSAYTVKSGDSLWAIANKYGLTVTKLKELNSLNTNTIYIGQALKVSNTAATTNSSSSSSTSAMEKTYTVKSGDSLWQLAVKYNTTVTQIKSTNHLSSDTIYVGQSLTIK